VDFRSTAALDIAVREDAACESIPPPPTAGGS
jgi:hypothetical protein